MTEHVRVETNNGILTLTLARPDKKNALTDAMYRALADAIESAESDPSVRVILFRSASLSPDGAPYEWLADGPWEYAARATPQRLLQLVREHLSR